MDPLRLSALTVYPVKSLAGIVMQRAPLGVRGFRYDRRWMLVDDNARFMSQREFPRMSLIQPAIIPAGLRLRAPGRIDLIVPFEPAGAPGLGVQVWDDHCVARTCGPRSDSWFSEFLGVACRLVFLPDTSVRQVDQTYARADDQVGFADGFPFLVISSASLEDLNGRLEKPVAMRRFRPNLVIGGARPYAEDHWRRIEVGKVRFRIVKPCSRCIITTVDPATGERDVEPLRTLRAYRRKGNKVFFGQNALHDGPGEIRVGDVVRVLEGR